MRERGEGRQGDRDREAKGHRGQKQRENMREIREWYREIERGKERERGA